MIVIVPCFAGFTFVVYIMFGPYVYTYHTFSYSLKSVIFFILGQLDAQELIMSNTFVAVVWTFLFYFFLIFIFLSLFMAIFINSLKETISSDAFSGYPEDFMDKSRWDFGDYVYWVIEEWAPKKVWVKFKRHKLLMEEKAVEVVITTD